MAERGGFGGRLYIPPPPPSPFLSRDASPLAGRRLSLRGHEREKSCVASNTLKVTNGKKLPVLFFLDQQNETLSFFGPNPRACIQPLATPRGGRMRSASRQPQKKRKKRGGAAFLHFPDNCLGLKQREGAGVKQEEKPCPKK